MTAPNLWKMNSTSVNLPETGFVDGSVFGRDLKFLQLVKAVETVNDFPEDGVLQVQTVLGSVGDEELGAVRVRTGVGH